MLTPEQVLRYKRNIAVDVIRESGQEKLLGARVLVVGAGGLGSPICLYLAAAGIGTLGIADQDHVSLGNLQRQILYRTGDIGLGKALCAAREIRALNPDVNVIPVETPVNAGNADEIIASYDVIVSAVDNFPSRYILNDACIRARKPLVEAGVLRFDGLLLTIKPFEGPCYRCLFPEEPREGSLPSPAQSGIIGAVAGVAGCLQALEVIKLVTGVGSPVVGRILLFDGLDTSFREIRIDRNPLCPSCGEQKKSPR